MGEGRGNSAAERAAGEAAPALGGLHHAAIQVVDLPAAERFYAGILGLPVLRRWPWPSVDEGGIGAGRAGERSLWLGLGNGLGAARGDFLALEACDGPAAPATEFRDPTPGLHVLALRIEARDRAAWLGRLRLARVTIERETTWSIFFRDPEGNRIALSHHPEEG